MVGPAVFTVVLVSVTVILLALCQQTPPRLPLMATVRGSGHLAASGQRFMTHSAAHAASRISMPAGPRSSREARGRGRDPLRDHRAVVGPDTRTPWYIRVRSLILLVLLVIGIGMAIAGTTLLVLASGRFVIEILAG